MARPGISSAASGASLPAHTPGPWRADGNTNGNFYGVSAFREGFRGIPVVVWRGLGRPSTAEGRANAHLIAAAPDLLAALERTSQALRLAFSQKPLRDMAETLAEADAALAKALGADPKDGTTEQSSRSGRTPK